MIWEYFVWFSEEIFSMLWEELLSVEKEEGMCRPCPMHTHSAYNPLIFLHINLHSRCRLQVEWQVKDWRPMGNSQIFFIFFTSCLIL